MMSLQPCIPYLRLHLSLAHHQALPDELDEQQQAELDRQLQWAARLQRALISQPAASQCIPSEQAVEQARQTLVSRFAEPAQFLATLEHHGLSESDLAQALTMELWSDAVADLLCASLPTMSELDAELYYQLHRPQFERPEQRLARHLLITINDEIAGNSREESLARIRRLRDQLLRAPHHFGGLAGRYSECPTALKEGVLGWCKRGQLFPAIDQALFTLPAGGLSLAVESPIGFHLVRCDEIAPARLMPFAEALPLIQARHRQRARKKHLASLL